MTIPNKNLKKNLFYDISLGCELRIWNRFAAVGNGNSIFLKNHLHTFYKPNLTLKWLYSNEWSI